MSWPEAANCVISNFERLERPSTRGVLVGCGSVPQHSRKNSEMENHVAEPSLHWRAGSILGKGALTGSLEGTLVPSDRPSATGSSAPVDLESYGVTRDQVATGVLHRKQRLSFWHVSLILAAFAIVWKAAIFYCEHAHDGASRLSMRHKREPSPQQWRLYGTGM